MAVSTGLTLAEGVALQQASLLVLDGILYSAYTMYHATCIWYVFKKIYPSIHKYNQCLNSIHRQDIGI